MKDKLIKNYINKLTKNDIVLFAEKNNIILSNQELDYIYYIVKNNYKEIIYNNHDNIFKELKNNVEISNYNKIVHLFKVYKNKYQSFL